MLLPFILTVIGCSNSDQPIPEFEEEVVVIQGYPRHVDLSELVRPETFKLTLEVEPGMGTISLGDQTSGYRKFALYEANAGIDLQADEAVVSARDIDGNTIARKKIKIVVERSPDENIPYGECQGSLFRTARIKQDSVLTIDLMNNAILCNIGQPERAFFRYNPSQEYPGIAFYISEEYQIMLYQAPPDFTGQVRFDYEICYVFSDDFSVICADLLNNCDSYPEQICDIFIQASAVIEVVE